MAINKLFAVTLSLPKQCASSNLRKHKKRNDGGFDESPFQNG